MPFTLSHPAAAIALRRTGLPMAAMVCGTIVPDVPLFLHLGATYAFTHSWAGILTVDLGVGLVALLSWHWLMRDAVIDSSPATVRERFPARVRYSARQWCLAPVAVLLASLTHVGWDELTHVGRWGPEHVAWLRHRHLGVAGYHWAQAGSSALGLVLVAATMASAYRRRSRRARPATVPQLAGRGVAGVVGVAVLTGLVTVGVYAGDGVHVIAFRAAVASVTASAVAALCAATAWRVLARRTA